MSLKTQALKNISSIWFGLGVRTVTGFFLAPLILHKLGDAAFGVWVLIFALTGYYGLLDLGIRSSIVQYVARFSATRDHDRLIRFVNTALFSYSCIALFLIVATVAGAHYITGFFHLPPELTASARLAWLIVGSIYALQVPFIVYAAMLEGLGKFSVLNLTDVATSVFRAAVVIVALKYGGGLLTISFITIVCGLGGYLVHCLVAHRNVALRYGWRFVDRRSFRDMTGYSTVTLVAKIADTLRLQGDAVIVGLFLPPLDVTVFSIGSKPVGYAAEVVGSMAQIFTPLSSRLDAAGDVHRLRQLLVAGNGACAIVAFPLCAALLILGGPLIEVWMGAKYLSVSYPILAILAVAFTAEYAQKASTNILFGMARHKLLAGVRLAEALANVILSVALVRHLGILGVALGTAIPMLCVSLVFLPQHLCRLLSTPLGRFLGQAYGLPLVLCTPVVCILLLLQRVFPAHSYATLIIHVLAGCLTYGMSVAAVSLAKDPTDVGWRAVVGQLLGSALGRRGTGRRSC